MSFNRLKYDIGLKRLDDESSVKAGNYVVNTPIITQNCFQTNPRIIDQKVGVSMSKNSDWRFYAGPVDVESQLLNLNRRASRDPATKYNPLKDACRDNDSCLINLPDCYFPTSDTRLSNPATNLRGINIERFDPLCQDPQKNVFFPGSKLIPTRLVVKDTFNRATPRPAINSMAPAPINLACQKTNSVCVAPTYPLYQYDKCG
jgi:hypothetical protein